ncbi:hypothetical protein VMT65_11855 [Nocardia sp. CDC153]|uniref:hypothetical protein n=1 Tax=Nocardia sp. CDC153 TaxID=3112167 RepID=UPI002DBD4CD9|nr:hypothetical protein [Nocardia sp. CDC153]MEC3953730.1 hypothetical protein [Nocardia sp. CDC153]
MGYSATLHGSYFPGRCQTITLRSGVPGEHVVDVAAEKADMIVLGWSQQLLPGRARIVRKTVVAESVPVMLVPVGAGKTHGVRPGTGMPPA